MSHWTKVKTQVKELETMKSIAEECGCTCVMNSEIRGYAGRRQKADLVLKLKGINYDIGFVKEGDGYNMVADWYGIRDKSIKTKLLQGYSKRIVIRELRRKGYSIVPSETKEVSGTKGKRLRMVMRKR